jgi:hypothetical protein
MHDTVAHPWLFTVWELCRKSALSGESFGEKEREILS